MVDTILEVAGAWIFLSHSNEDYDQVTTVRNFLERRGHRPIMFFLRAITSDDELKPLLEREIRARSWFVLCDSDNAEDSELVQWERDVITGLDPKRYSYHAVNLEADDLDAQLFALGEALRPAMVFLSYSHVDEKAVAAVSAIGDLLSSQDFGLQMKSADDVTVGGVWRDEIESMINQAIDRGVYVPLVSRVSRAPQSGNSELDLAFDIWSRVDRPGRIPVLPVEVEEGSMATASRRLTPRQAFRFWEYPDPRTAAREFATVVRQHFL